MNSLKARLMQKAAEAAQRLALTLRGQLEYQSLESFEEDFDLVCVLLEEANDELKPKLEEKARRPAE